MNKNTINNIFESIIEKKLHLPKTAAGREMIAGSEDLLVKYFIDNHGVFYKGKSGKKHYRDIMYARRKPITKKTERLIFFDIISPNLYSRLSEKEQLRFFPVVKIMIIGPCYSHSIYQWCSLEDLWNHNYNMNLNVERLYTNKYRDDERACYPAPITNNTSSPNNYYNKIYSNTIQ